MTELSDIVMSIFTLISKLASEHDAINLSWGFPNFPVDPVLTDIVVRLAKENVHQYLPMAVCPPLLANHFI
jgi:methionine aminotransferase